MIGGAMATAEATRAVCPQCGQSDQVRTGRAVVADGTTISQTQHPPYQTIRSQTALAQQLSDYMPGPKPSATSGGCWFLGFGIAGAFWLVVAMIGGVANIIHLGEANGTVTIGIVLVLTS
jgi:apolipoprotein N-acyltransferase